MWMTCGIVGSFKPAISHTTICFASTITTTTEQLRSQLDQLHAEAQSTKAKASGSRSRLMRLSETAEKLKRHAAVSLHSGNEDYARELLFQKKKVTQAMERSKSRIELLDQLYAKLNEAIAVKESHLIRNAAFDLEVESDNHVGQVHIVSPTESVADESEGIKDTFSKAAGVSDSQDLQLCTDGEASPQIDKELESVCVANGNERSILTGLKSMSSYIEFLGYLDAQLNGIETELVTFLNVSAFVLNDGEKLNNLKVQQTMELLESIRAIRRRLEQIMQIKMDVR